MPDEKQVFNLNVDNRDVDFSPGQTILQVAEQHDIYIPTLCAHPTVSPFGGCRMCMVEVDGMRGFPTACTTPAQEGMVIRTKTTQLQAMRSDILQLILSEHPASCLLCGESAECRQHMRTTRKVGVISGCRTCPNDSQCQLQEVVEWLEVKEIDYPIYYRMLPVEKEDPFYDRDYNLCILCGRCVRECQEVRGANVLTFKQRGRHTVVGPAYDRTHLESGCEFCGACLSVCPTGALSEKVSKWLGAPQSKKETTCTLCGLGCQVELLVRDGQVIGSLPGADALVNDGQLCVKGRFGITEVVTNYDRLQNPYYFQHGARVDLSWEDAVQQAIDKLSDCAPDEFALLISPQAANEALYVAQKFARLVMKTNQVASDSHMAGSQNGASLANMLSRITTIENLRAADQILSVVYEPRFDRSVLGVEIRMAVQRGADLITIHPHEHGLEENASHWLQPQAGQAAGFLKELMQAIGSLQKESPPPNDLPPALLETARCLIEASHPVLVFGTSILQDQQSASILTDITKLAEILDAGIVAPPLHANTLGTLWMGTHPQLLPGGLPLSDETVREKLSVSWDAAIPEGSQDWNRTSLMTGKHLKVLYLIGENPFPDARLAEYVIYQNVLPPPEGMPVDLVLPAAAFSEEEGTLLSAEGRLRRLAKAVDPPGKALPDWMILARIASQLGHLGFEYADLEMLQKEIGVLVEGFDGQSDSIINLNFLQRAVSVFKAPVTAPKKDNGMMLYTHPSLHNYRGIHLPDRVLGLKVVYPEDQLSINPFDASEQDIQQGESVLVKGDSFEYTRQVRLDSGQPAGTLSITHNHPQSYSVAAIPHVVKIRKI